MFFLDAAVVVPQIDAPVGAREFALAHERRVVVAPQPVVDRAVREDSYAPARALALDERAGVGLARGPLHDTLTVGDAPFEQPGVPSSIIILQRPVAVLQGRAAVPLALALDAVFRGHAPAVRLAVGKHAAVRRAGRGHARPLAARDAVSPLAAVGAPVPRNEVARSVAHAVAPFPTILGPISIRLRAGAVLAPLLKLAFVLVPGGVHQDSRTVERIVFPLALVGRAVNLRPAAPGAAAFFPRPAVAKGAVARHEFALDVAHEAHQGPGVAHALSRLRGAAGTQPRASARARDRGEVASSRCEIARPHRRAGRRRRPRPCWCRSQGLANDIREQKRRW